MKHTDWMNSTTGNESVRATALKAGLAQRTLANQIEKEHISAENVIAIAIAYGAHPVRALVDTGYLDEKYARTVDPLTALRSITEDQLADEVLRRMKRGLKTDEFTTDINEVETRRRSKQQKPVSIPDDVMPVSAVADDSPDEDEMRGDPFDD
ncbi:hypothetical protein ACKFRJ_10810 [Corynebacterium kefirresidentii]|uniref:hypothetical protein n=1 Tax=Corynebacterium kefirresidentii TaxID=1979527 RepID=UPI0038D11D1B